MIHIETIPVKQIQVRCEVLGLELLPPSKKDREDLTVRYIYGALAER